MIKFPQLSAQEMTLINEITTRAVKAFKDIDIIRDPIDIQMDVESVHASSGLRLYDFANADPFSFAHDIFGINRNLNRDTGKLENHFLPRFSK